MIPREPTKVPKTETNSKLPFGLSLSKPVLSLPKRPRALSEMPFDHSQAHDQGEWSLVC